MQKHKLLELQKLIEERTGSLVEEVEIATNVKFNPLYIADRKDEIESLRWTTRIIRWNKHSIPILKELRIIRILEPNNQVS